MKVIRLIMNVLGELGHGNTTARKEPTQAKVPVGRDIVQVFSKLSKIKTAVRCIVRADFHQLIPFNCLYDRSQLVMNTRLLYLTKD